MLPALLVFTGCATKGYVNGRIDDLRTAHESRLGTLDRETAELRNSTQDALQRAESASGDATEARDMALGRAGLTEVSSHTVFFAFDSDDLNDEARSALDQAALEIQRQPEVIVDIYGFTDEIGPDRYNYDLGQRRAMAAMRYLVESTPGQLSKFAAVSFGEKSLAAKPADSPDRARNRRVVVSLIKRIPLSESSMPSASLE
jgi:outer membrane protein OmpA-like peptidoglycan-associated protein